MRSVGLAATAMAGLEDDPGHPRSVRPARAWSEPELDLGELARRAGEGCDESFALLVGRFSARVFNYLYRLTGRHHDAEDLTQETFLKAYRGLRRHQRPQSFQAWILTIARRTALNHFRSARATEPLRPELQVDSKDPSTLAAEQDEQGAIWRVARRLKPRQYEALWLHYAEGLSIEETAQVTRLGRIHVRVLLHRARAQLAKHLVHGGRVPDSPRKHPDSPRRTP